LRGERNLPETIELVKIRTRQFAKRQMTWFRKSTRMTWIDCAPEDDAASAARRIMELFRGF
jgi:tRNA dimethylallyltransferase